MLHRQKRQLEALPLLERAAVVEPGYQVHLIRGSNFQQLERREEAIRAWKAQTEHRVAQAAGRDIWYEQFEVRIARVERAYGK